MSFLTLADENTSTHSPCSPDKPTHVMYSSQFFDMMKDVGSNNSPTTLFLNHGPSAVTELKDQLKDTIMTKAS